MISATAPGTAEGISVLVGAARAAAVAHGAIDDVAGLAVRVMAEAALGRRPLAGHDALSLSITLAGTELVLALRDQGEPVSSPPVTMLRMVDLGFLDTADARTDGTGNVTEARLPLPSHTVMLDDTDLEVLDDETPLSDAPVVMRPLEADDAAALTRCIYRCYGWTYPNTDLYFPDRLAASILSGQRVGEVAVDPSGEVAAHWGAVFVADGVVETGATVTDPRFRRRGLANDLGERLLERLVAMGVRGRMREPVLTHPATQQIALREGAHPVGVYLHASPPLQQVGITDGMLAERISVSVFFSPLAEMPAAEVHIPATFEPLVRRILEPAGWPVSIAAARTNDAPERSVLRASYTAEHRTGGLVVEIVGTDLADAVDDALTGLRSAGAEMATVQLPAAQPALAVCGAGLSALGLGFATFLPDMGSYGPALTLQWLADPDIDMSAWVFADERVESLIRAIAEQARDLGDDIVRRRRRQARRLRLFAALPVAEG